MLLKPSVRGGGVQNFKVFPHTWRGGGGAGGRGRIKPIRFHIDRCLKNSHELLAKGNGSYFSDYLVQRK